MSAVDRFLAALFDRLAGPSAAPWRLCPGGRRAVRGGPPGGGVRHLGGRAGRALADFVPACWWQQTSPQSHFTRSTVCSRLTGDGRISLSGRTLIRTSGGTRTEQPLASDEAVLAAYREHFGIVLDRVPAAPPAS